MRSMSAGLFESSMLVVLDWLRERVRIARSIALKRYLAVVRIQRYMRNVHWEGVEHI